MPYITQNNLKINSATLAQVQDLCLSKDTSNDPLIMGIVGYQNISDEMCIYWNNAWKGDERNYAKAACFSGNYNYELLRAFGLSNDTEIQIIPNFKGDQTYVDKADWALGAAIEATETCYKDDSHDSSDSNVLGYVAVGLISGFAGLAVGFAGVLGALGIYQHVNGISEIEINFINK